MPFLKPVKITVTKKRIESCKRNGFRHAIFILHGSSKKQYTGEWKDDKRNGKGTEFDMQSGLIYEGDWLNNAKHGYGVVSKILKDKTLVTIYSGNWMNGKREGFGGFWYEDDTYYEGNFHENKRHGFGRMWKINGEFYQGTWKNDSYHGEGMLVLENGDRFEGHFSRGKKEGRGIFYHMRTGQSQEGRWIRDACTMSILEDACWRQSAAKPTAYPIPKNELKNRDEVVASQFQELSRDSSSFCMEFEDYTRANEDCQ